MCWFLFPHVLYYTVHEFLDPVSARHWRCSNFPCTFHKVIRRNLFSAPLGQDSVLSLWTPHCLKHPKFPTE